LHDFAGTTNFETGSNQEGAMSTRTEDPPVTADELLRMADRGVRLALVRGQVRKRPFAGAMEGRLGATLALGLLEHVRRNELGTVYAGGTGFQLASGPDTVLAPSMAFVRRGRAGETAESFFPGPPDLVVEIVSFADDEEAMQDRVREWLDAATRMVILVDPRRRTVTVYHPRDDIHVLGEDDVLDGGDVVPGWTLPVQELFS
jgi:Uma2 family endonuclease